MTKRDNVCANKSVIIVIRMETIYFLALEFIARVDLIIILSVAAALVVVETLTVCLLVKRGKIKTQKIFVHLIFSGGLCVIVTAFTLVNGTVTGVTPKLFLPLTSLGLCVLATIPVKLVSGKTVISQSQIDLARFIDGEYKKQVAKNEPKASEHVPPELKDERVKTLKASIASEEKRDSRDVDFTHVKNVIDRLSYHNLSPSDKRVVNELTANVSLAEQGEFDLELKSKINDGLGLLLKIMSKYKV